MNSSEPGNSQIRDMLRRRAQETSKTLRWNRNVLLLTYTVLAATVVVALSVESALVAALVAVPGLAVVWVFSTRQSRKMEKQIFEDDVRAYSEFIHRPSSEGTPASRNDSPLSDRELEVLQQIASGRSNKEAALALSISEQTIKNHLKHIFEKLRVSDRTSAVMTGIRHGWIASGTPIPRSKR